MLEDYIEGTSLTYIKNHNYWGYDEHYPENRIPYIDKLKELIIPNESTAFAAFRIGKISMIENVNREEMRQLVIEADMYAISQHL